MVKNKKDSKHCNKNNKTIVSFQTTKIIIPIKTFKMKKTILGLALSLLIGTASFANNDETINQKAEQSFKKEFVQAKDVSWQKSGDLVKATFTLNDRVLFAYYNETGDLVAITRNITIPSTGCPICLKWFRAVNLIITSRLKMLTIRWC
jgi:hypothetical protein